MKYRIVLDWSAEDNSFIAEVPELPGCAVDGPTRQEALANVEVIIAEWIETARELGRAVPDPQVDALISNMEYGPEGSFHSESDDS